MTEDKKFKSALRLLKSIGNNPSFDIDEFIDRISVSEEWAKIIVAHIYLDHIVTEVLNERLDHPKSYFGRYRSFTDKLSLCQSLGYFRGEFGSVLEAINTSRNTFAHKLVFNVSDEEKIKLFQKLATKRPDIDVTNPGGFEEFLFTVVMFAEVSRAGEKRKSEISKEQNAVQENILAILIANKKL